MNLTIEEQSGKEQARVQSLAFLLSIFVCGALSAYFIFLYADMPHNDRNILLDNKINPNTDTAVSMARLPSLGATKAKAIVEHRQNGNAFESAQDLDNVKGIGPKTVESVKPYLKFE
jgi:competence ComEA-like helix-hairpin-helix protein